MKYQTRHLTIDAFQIDPSNSENWPDWFKHCFWTQPEEPGHVCWKNGNLHLQTKGGLNKIQSDTYVCRSEDGEIFITSKARFGKMFTPSQN